MCTETTGERREERGRREEEGGAQGKMIDAL